MLLRTAKILITLLTRFPCGQVMLLLYNEDGSYPADSSLVTVISLLIEAGVPGVALLQGGYFPGFQCTF